MSYQAKTKSSMRSFIIFLGIILLLVGISGVMLYYMLEVVPSKEATSCIENAVTRASTEWKCDEVFAVPIGHDVVVRGCDKKVVYQCTGGQGRRGGPTPRLPSEICGKED